MEIEELPCLSSSKSGLMGPCLPHSGQGWRWHRDLDSRVGFLSTQVFLLSDRGQEQARSCG